MTFTAAATGRAVASRLSHGRDWLALLLGHAHRHRLRRFPLTLRLPRWDDPWLLIGQSDGAHRTAELAHLSSGSIPPPLRRASPVAPRLKRCNDVGCHANAVRGCHTTTRCRAGAGAIVAQSTSATPTTVDGVRTTTASSLTQCGPLAPAASIQPAIRWKEHPKSRTAGSETSSVIAI